jgi:hypothetical protein
MGFRMTQANLALYEPVCTLKPVGENIWIADGPIVKMAVYGTFIPFPSRMTLVRLENGDLWCHSPIALTEGLQAEIDEMGPVRYLISPNKIHYAHIGSWAQVYPKATAWASGGVRERAAQQQIEVNFDADLTEEVPPEWKPDLDQVIFRGSRFMDEVVFFHRPSRTLILTDLIENFELHKVPPQYKLLVKLGGIVDPDGKTPLDLRMTFLGRKELARVGLKQMLAWEPDKIILAHGRWYDRNGTAELRRAFRWLGSGEAD